MVIEPLQKFVVRVEVVEFAQQSILRRVDAFANIANRLGEEEVKDWVVLVELALIK